LFGYQNCVVRVDLSNGKISKEALSKDIIRDYVGGIGIGVKVIYDEVPPGIGALDPENRFVLAVGPLTGTMVPGSSRYHVVSKSPQTTFTISVADSGGFFASEFKFAGYDALIVQGAAKKPVYIWINDETVEICDAAKIWGKDTFETEKAIKETLGDSGIRVACIGPAGENLSGLACIENDEGHVAARGGLGAVMGSKKLKAIAAKGTKKVQVKDQKKLVELFRDWKVSGVKHGNHIWGTGYLVPLYYELGALPVKNLQTNVFPEYEKMSGQYLRKTFNLVKRKPCFNCYMAHLHFVEVTEGPYKGFVGEEPEFESINGFGFNLGIADLGAVIKISDLCDRLGMDVLSTSWTLSMIMECYEKGIVTKERLDGLELRWGNAEAVLDILEKIAHRKGIGDTLAEGPGFAAERLGNEAPKYAVHCKNMGIKCVDTRGLIGRSLAFAVASSGPQTEHSPGLYTGGIDPELGFAKGLDFRSPDGMAEATKKGGMKKVFMDTLGVCIFPVRVLPLKSHLLEALEAVTGLKMGLDEALTIGERIINLERCFNIRHGLTPRDDTLSERLLTTPTDGPAKGISSRSYMMGMVSMYYRLMGWDLKTGKPLRSTLRRLGLHQVQKDIWY
jgi:aldehyde:ferredoxin oxidoreductase